MHPDEEEEMVVLCMCVAELPAPSCMGRAASGYEMLLMLLIIISKAWL